MRLCLLGHSCIHPHPILGCRHLHRLCLSSPATHSDTYTYLPLPHFLKSLGLPDDIRILDRILVYEAVAVDVVSLPSPSSNPILMTASGLVNSFDTGVLTTRTCETSLPKGKDEMTG